MNDAPTSTNETETMSMQSTQSVQHVEEMHNMQTTMSDMQGAGDHQTSEMQAMAMFFHFSLTDYFLIEQLPLHTPSGMRKCPFQGFRHGKL